MSHLCAAESANSAGLSPTQADTSAYAEGMELREVIVEMLVELRAIRSLLQQAIA